MLKRSLAAGLLACAALTPAAFAQDKPAQNQSAQTDSIKFVKEIQAEQFRSSNLVGQTVYNRQDENIGDISDLILDRNGKVAGVIIGVGGFLGIGKSEVAVPMNALKFERDDNAMASNESGNAGADNAATGRAAAEADVEKQPGSAGQPSGTSTGAALPNQDRPDQGNAQQNAAEGADQAKQDPAAAKAAADNNAAGNSSAANQSDTNRNDMAANDTADTSAEENWLDGMKIVLNTTRDDLGNAPKLGETETDAKQ